MLNFLLLEWKIVHTLLVGKTSFNGSNQCILCSVLRLDTGKSSASLYMTQVFVGFQTLNMYTNCVVLVL